jgi:hypothetical protein
MNTVDIDTLEWWSNCCDAPPLHELYYKEEYGAKQGDAQPLGMCMKCRENAVFYLTNRRNNNESN